MLSLENNQSDSILYENQSVTLSFIAAILYPAIDHSMAKLYHDEHAKGMTGGSFTDNSYFFFFAYHHLPLDLWGSRTTYSDEVTVGY